MRNKPKKPAKELLPAAEAHRMVQPATIHEQLMMKPLYKSRKYPSGDEQLALDVPRRLGLPIDRKPKNPDELVALIKETIGAEAPFLTLQNQKREEDAVEMFFSYGEYVTLKLSVAGGLDELNENHDFRVNIDGCPVIIKYAQDIVPALRFRLNNLVEHFYELFSRYHTSVLVKGLGDEVTYLGQLYPPGEGNVSPL